MSAMPTGELLLTELDRARLLKLGDDDLPETVLDLVRDATAVPSQAIPPQVVTMYSQVLVSPLDGGPAQTLTLCYPADAEPGKGFISVLSPVGSALLGRASGATVRWTAPDGKQRQMRIERILFQPEATGDYTI